MRKRFRDSGYLMALLATLVWSGNFIVARDLNETYTPVAISFFRWLIACIVILPIAWSSLKRDFHLLVGQWKLMLVLAFLGVTLFNTMIYLAAHSTSVLNLSLLAITAPLYVVILNRIIFKEHLTWRQTTGFVILLIGLITLLTEGEWNVLLSLNFNKGDLVMASAATLFAIYTVLVKKKNPAIGNLSFVSGTFILGELLIIPFFAGELIILKTELAFTQPHILQLIYIGVGPSVISYYLWNKSIFSIGSTKAATIYNTLPIFSAALAALLLHESILLIQVISSIIIIGGVTMVILGGKQKPLMYDTIRD